MNKYYMNKVERYVRPADFDEVVGKVLEDKVLEIPEGLVRTIQNVPEREYYMSKIFRLVIDKVTEKTVKLHFYGKTRYGKEIKLLKTSRLKKHVAEHEIYAFATGRDFDLGIELGRLHNYESDKILELQKKKQAIQKEARDKVSALDKEIKELFYKEFKPVLASGDLKKARAMVDQFSDDCGLLGTWAQHDVWTAERDENIRKQKENKNPK